MILLDQILPIIILAQEQQGEPNSILSTLILIPIMGLFLYFMVIRPQNKEEENRKKMISELNKGDTVVTSSGIYGKIVEFRDNDDSIVLNIAKDTNVTFTTSSILKKK
ncbi:MAG: preprotein translocase subunit YajC [Leptospiraceae bacterium]|nr:preprotein translocase subunit YajC [Leptospiraceae bacterium]MCP5511722.1 preprotein translocase subunit YajC [Leptospiraceae bacterium]